MGADFFEHKVLPFKNHDGEQVPGHAIQAARLSDGSYVESVVFWTFDSEADMPIETLVHVGRLTKWVQRKHPGYGELRAVITSKGQRLHATSLSVRHYDSEAWKKAPPLTRGPFKVVGLCSRQLLVEVVGVSAWSHSKRRPEDAALILDPFERDNAEFHARMSALQAKTAEV